MHLLRKFLCLLIGTIICTPIFAQDEEYKIVRTLPVNARLVAVDELENTYIVRADNVLIRFDKNGDSTGFYRSVLNGDIDVIDVTNPLRILLYYRNYAKIILLDRMLSELITLDLRKLDILTATSVGTATDGRMWVYDPFNARLIKFDENGTVVRTSNDLRQQVNFVPIPQSIVERDRRVFIADLANGILSFDQFANYITTIPVKGIEKFQVFGNQILYRNGDTLVNYNLQLFNERKLLLPTIAQQPIQDMSIGVNTLSILYTKQLVIYKWDH